MDALCGLFEAVTGVGELLGRGGQKEEELTRLDADVLSISQSVGAFVAPLLPQERDAVFNSNKVWPQIKQQLELCHEVIEGHRRDRPPERPQLEDGKPMLSALKRGASSGSKLFREGLEALGGRLGAGAPLLRLPEDELAKLKQASAELSRLVPQLHLAMLVQHIGGQKRCASVAWAPGSTPRKSLRPAGDAAGLEDCGDVEGSKPRLCMQLVSESGPGVAEALPALSELELRPVSIKSTSSLESGSSASTAAVVGSAAGDAAGRRFVFGRLELRDRVPRSLVAAPLPGELPQLLHRFVSRDFFILELPSAPEPSAVLDSLDMPTLKFGVADEDGPTLPLGGWQETPGLPTEAPVLASVISLSAAGLHLRRFGKTEWQWMSKDATALVHEGDSIALVLLSLPGGGVAVPPRDLGAEEAQCLLGIRFGGPAGLEAP